MKKMVLSAAIAALFLVSCNNADSKKVETKDTVTTTDTQGGVAQTTTTETTTTTEVPKFSSPEAQQLADDYTKYVNEYVAAAKSGDATKIQELAGKQQEWATKTATALTKLTPEDAKLWSEYAQKLAAELTASAAK
ncbi:hypothetical protein D7322_11850 [Sphingobacterium puteale]|uniref:Lysozyme inhibitor LprI N-terminal domain-containing protein n=3 Tax=Sphingobacteriaceae TaxID=84566 RepID=A0A363NMF5_9SPHI|nr:MULTISPECIES: hypothetical protein [unclassified Sphingobacterium]PUV21999.1 hypothetical protein DCO56_23985 [Sphingobacterium athyrii]QIH31855.1 hypothetical protein G6053_02575 [Sphingobacterium sp. DR205]RKO71444.1 hypothetical protein D7322_11850 [Sphingobacterium puteale]